MPTNATGKRRISPRAPPTGPLKLLGQSKTYARRDTDITLDPEIITALKKGMLFLNTTQAGVVEVALQRFFLHLQQNPTAVIPRTPACPTCGRQIQAKRPKGTRRRVRISITLPSSAVAAITWIADNYFHGTYSRALEAALIFFLPEAILPRGAKESL